MKAFASEMTPKAGLVLLAVFLVWSSSFAQAPDTTKNVKLTGSAQTDLVSDRITGMGQNRPPWVNRLYLYPTLEFYGYKLGFTFLLSSEEKKTRQPFDRFGTELRFPSRKASGGLKADYRRVDQGFASLGSPNLLNDIQGLTLNGDLTLRNGLVGLRAGYEDTRDNVENLKPSTTRTTTWHSDLAVLPARLPYLTLGYSGYGQKNDEANDTTKVHNLTGAFSAVAGANLTLLSLRQSASFSWALQDFKDKRPLAMPGSDYRSQTGTWSHAVDFPFPVSASYSLGLTRTRGSGGDQTEDLKSGSAELAHRALKDRLRTRVQYVQEKGSGTRLGFPIDQMKTTYRAGTSWNGEKFNAGLTWERIRYDDRAVGANSYNETVVTTSAGMRF